MSKIWSSNRSSDIFRYAILDAFRGQEVHHPRDTYMHERVISTK